VKTRNQLTTNFLLRFHLSLLKSGKVKGVRFSTLEAIGRCLECQPEDLLEYRPATDTPPDSSAPPPRQPER
jgi:DNA-binding Xre family transcriptional regulator